MRTRGTLLAPVAAVLLFILEASSAPPAERSKPVGCERSLLVGEVVPIEHVSSLPQVIQDFLEEKFADPSDSGLSGIAEPGTAFNATDAVEPDIPWRRLIIAGQVGDIYFLAYERGGIAYNHHVLVFDLSKHPVRACFSAVLRKGQFIQEPPPAAEAVEGVQRQIKRGLANELDNPESLEKY